MPERGSELLTPEQIQAGLDYTRDFVTTLFGAANEAMTHTRKAVDPKFRHVFNDEHGLPFDVTRAVDEASDIKHPRIQTAERDREMWHSLRAAGYRRSVPG